MSIRFRWKWQFNLLIVLFAFIGLFSFAFVIVYNVTAERIKEDAVNRLETYIRRGAEEINSTFSTYWWNLLPEIEDLSEVKSLGKVKDTLEAQNHAQLIQLCSRLKAMPELYSSDISFMLYFDTVDGFACTPTNILNNIRNDISQGVISVNNMSYDDFAGWVHSESNNYVLVQKSSVNTVTSKIASFISDDDCLFVIRRLSVNERSSNVYAIWMMPVDKIRSILVGESDASEYLALRRNNEVIYSNNPDIELEASDQDICYKKDLGKTLLTLNLAYLGLKCTLSLDDDTVLAQIRQFSILLKVLLFVFVILSLAVATVAALYYISPLQHMYFRLIAPSMAVQGKGSNIFVQLENRFDEISVNQQQLEEQLSQRQSILHKNLLDKLLKQSYITPAEREIVAALPGLQTESEFRVIITGCISEALNTKQTSNSPYEEVIRSILPYSIVSVIGKNRFAVLLPEDIASPQASINHNLQREAFSLLLDALNKTAESENAFALGVGFCYSGIYNAYKSYDEAKKAFHEAELWKKSAVIDYNVTNIDSSRYNLSYSDIIKMQNLLETGDAEGAGDILDESVADIFSADNYNYDTHLICQQLYYDVAGMFMRMPHEPNIMAAASMTEYDEAMSLNKLIETLKSSFFYIAEILASKSEGKNDLSQSILQYIMEHYMEPELSLTMLSEAFAMSERSLSRYFKDKLGETFSVTLERLRLSEAETLLIQSGLSVKEVAEKVGYLNTVTFYKAFKRRNGITPSEWVLNRKNLGVSAC